VSSILPLRSILLLSAARRCFVYYLGGSVGETGLVRMSFQFVSVRYTIHHVVQGYIDGLVNI
jgi:hypothetical protein